MADDYVTCVERKFLEFPSTAEFILDRHSGDQSVLDSDEHNNLCAYVAKNIIGNDQIFITPFGNRKIVYCDYTASGRSLTFIEDFIRREVLPFYGNTHSSVTVTSEQSSLFVHEARLIIRNAVHASEHDAVIFTGTGSTSAVNLLIHALNLNQSPVLIVGSFEHHSNLLPWFECGAEVVRIPLDCEGCLNVQILEEKLAEYSASGRSVIGSFSACSNVTGQLSPVDKITSLLHRYNALSFWDYSAVAPYSYINMNPHSSGSNPGILWKDAIYFSGHKFVGGPQTPGVLVCKKSLFRNRSPCRPGGGTVFFVRRDNHLYLQAAEQREEGGTSDIVGIIRLGLCVQLKELITSDLIMHRELAHSRNAVEYWSNNENIVILGNLSAYRMPIFSIMIRHSLSGLFLHHNFVCAVLDDLFGIQCRAGCMCAGPYAQDLMGIDEELARQFEQILQEDSRLDRTHLRREGEYSNYEMLRPGFLRLNFPYFMSDEEANFVLKAVEIVANHAWKLLPQYRLNPETGEWHHKNMPAFVHRKWLGNISYASGEMAYNVKKNGKINKNFSNDHIVPQSFDQLLQEAGKQFDNAKTVAKRLSLGDDRVMFSGKAAELRWFLLGSEAKEYLIINNIVIESSTTKSLPFEPVKFALSSHSNSLNNREQLILTNFVEKSDLFIHNKDQSLLCSSLIDNENPILQPNLISGENLSDYNILESNLQHKLITECKIENNPQNIVIVTDINASAATCVNGDCCHRSITILDQLGTSRQNWHKRSVIVANADRTEPLRYRWFNPPSEIIKPMIRAIEEYDMLRDNDKVLVCLSGGKDSLSLLHSLRQYSFVAKKKGINFALGAITIDPGSASYDPSPLQQYVSGLNVTYLYEQQDILGHAKSLPQCDSICSFCSRLKRGRIYAAARNENFNVLAFGQHLDDLAESFLMSMFHNGALRTMKAHYTVAKGDLRVIRPFVYVREKHLRVFAEQNKLPIIAENCPACFESPKERYRIKQLLASQEVMFPDVFHQLSSALRPVMKATATNSAEMRAEIHRNCDGSLKNNECDSDCE